MRHTQAKQNVKNSKFKVTYHSALFIERKFRFICMTMVLILDKLAKWKTCTMNKEPEGCHNAQNFQI